MIGLKNEEILTYLILVIIGYFIAKMFSRTCNGFSVGGPIYNFSCYGNSDYLNGIPKQSPDELYAGNSNEHGRVLCDLENPGSIINNRRHLSVNCPQEINSENPLMHQSNHGMGTCYMED